MWIFLDKLSYLVDYLASNRARRWRHHACKRAEGRPHQALQISKDQDVATQASPCAWMHTQQEIQEAAQPISPSLKQPAIQPPKISRYTAENDRIWSQKEENIRRPSYLRLARSLRQDPWHIPTAQQQLPPWNQDRTHLTGKDTKEETKTRLWTSNHSRRAKRGEQLEAGAHCPAREKLVESLEEEAAGAAHLLRPLLVLVFLRATTITPLESR